MSNIPLHVYRCVWKALGRNTCCSNSPVRNARANPFRGYAPDDVLWRLGYHFQPGLEAIDYPRRLEVRHIGKASSCRPLTHATNHPSESGTSSATWRTQICMRGIVDSSKTLLSALPSSSVAFLLSTTPPPRTCRCRFEPDRWRRYHHLSIVSRKHPCVSRPARQNEGG